jgi:hypothetical protein
MMTRCPVCESEPGTQYNYWEKVASLTECGACCVEFGPVGLARVLSGVHFGPIRHARRSRTGNGTTAGRNDALVV